LVYALTVALTFWLINGLPFGLASVPVGGLIVGLAVGLKVGPAPTYRKPFDRRALAGELAFGLALVFAFGLTVVLTFGLVGAAAFGLKVGPAKVVASALPLELAGGLAFGPALALGGGLAFGLLGVGPKRERIVAGSPSQPITTSSRLALVFGLVLALAVGLTTGVSFGLAGGLGNGLINGVIYGVTYGLASGLVGGLLFGADCLIFHRAFRLWLRLHDLGPWEWPDFLHWASDHLIMRAMGATYQWVHLELGTILPRSSEPRGGRRDHCPL
jgi:hypothetical protein